MVLIVTSTISDKWIESAKEKHGITIWDQRDLRELGRLSGKPYEGLNEFLDSVNPPVETKTNQSRDTYERRPSIEDITGVLPKNFQSHPSRGDELYDQLTTNTTGARKWTKFESTVFDIMRYLHEKDLSGWYKNLKAESGSNRFELVCRINSKHDYWNRVASEFNTRYIFFECKEYAEIFGYKNVKSEDINVLAQAFRAIGFIITREDTVNFNGQLSQGAFYDNGKLLIHLTEHDLYQMLVDKDIGNDPTSLLREKLDQAIYNITF